MIMGIELKNMTSFRLKTGALPGWDRYGVMREPQFIKAAGIMALYGILVGFAWFLNKMQIISPDARSTMLTVFLYVFMFFGSLLIIGELDAKRTAAGAVLLLTGIVPPFLHYLLIYNRFIDLFLSAWLLFYWVWTEPDMMSQVGLNRNTLLRDLVSAGMILLVCGGYLVFFMKSYGFLATINFNDIALMSLGKLHYGLFTFMFLFAVWNALRFRFGAIHLGAILVFMVALMQTPTFLAYYVAGVTGPALLLAGMTANILMVSLLCGLVFPRLHNILPAALLFSLIISILHASGLL